jgi:ribonuclease PH
MMPVTSTSTTNRMLPASISLTSLSLADYNFDSLDKGSHNIIKERLEVIRIRLGSLGCDLSKLVECITGGKVLKKVILDEVSGEDGSHEVDMKAELKKVVDACKKKKTVELWKENFTVRRILLSTAKLI